jgi:DNA-binding NtrC family response regulator
LSKSKRYLSKVTEAISKNWLPQRSGVDRLFIMDVNLYEESLIAPVYGDTSHEYSPTDPVIVVYSDDQSVRSAIATALGKRLPNEERNHKIVEFATADALRLYCDEKRRVDLFILDGEAVPEGGMGLAHSLKDELVDCPPIMVIIQRVQDNWLARWSGAEAVISHPIDPFTLGAQVSKILGASTTGSR